MCVDSSASANLFFCYVSFKVTLLVMLPLSTAMVAQMISAVTIFEEDSLGLLSVSNEYRLTNEQ